MGIKDMREHHNLYLDLADCFRNLRKVNLETFGPKVSRFFVLNMTFDSYIEMLYIIKDGIQGVFTMPPADMLKSTIQTWKATLNKNTPTISCTYLDAYNLYGCMMSRHMPTNGLEWVKYLS